MPVLSVELQVAGVPARCDHVSFSFDQLTDSAGCPNVSVHLGRLVVVLSSEPALWAL